MDSIFLYQLKGIPLTYGKIEKSILQRLTHTKAKKVHIIFNRYFKPFIKDYKRSLRGNNDCHFYITGADQKRPVDFVKELCDNTFKKAFVNFLFSYWINNEVLLLANMILLKKKKLMK